MLRKLLGIFCLLLAICCLAGLGLDFGFIVMNGFDLTWWQFGLLLIPVPAVLVLLCAVFLTTGLDLLGIY